MHDFCLGLGNTGPLCPFSPRGLNQPATRSVLIKNDSFFCYSLTDAVYALRFPLT